MTTFYEDILKKHKLFNSPKRVDSLDLLDPIFRAKVQSIVDDAASHNIKLLVFETYRSSARQQQLFEEGASKLKLVSVHHYGLAADIVYLRGGEPSWKGDFNFLGQLSRAHQLIWGGNWGYPETPHSFVDADHVQWCTVRRQAPLFRGEWYPAVGYDPYQEL